VDEDGVGDVDEVVVGVEVEYVVFGVYVEVVVVGVVEVEVGFKVNVG